ncbi:MAG: efflux RND transporter periplasmic adaptor subunit [Rhodospirillaceae bacterium]|nr:efflux RND transporter periplasmic adaptor subunit [Rhodospirillaceae bacterium]MBT4220116.1 efflux RND transporter periplasmic adaptor subunit [Rhodospirillaceae bacterium]MBT5013763.1 efflux RND transporter periplasmic adaptor subunit [Rhodospirillaceae bacterium]MBT7356047.1 efflux RND transporter periplasmic adaptor subunit [Rhodospirillaceae bacterium]
MRNFTKFTILAILTVLSVSPSTGLAQKAEEKTEATPVGIDKVRTEPLSQTVPVIGRLVPAKSGVVASLIGGPISEMRVKVGDRVKRADIVAVLLSDSLYWLYQLAKAEEKRAGAALKTAEAVRNLRDQELTRIKQLKTSAAFSQARLEDKAQELVRATSAVAEAEATRQRTHANMKLAEIDFNNSKIRAPFDGVVAKRHTDVGTFVDTGSPVLSLIDDQHPEIEASVPAARINGLPTGTVVNFQLETNNRQYPATVRAVVPDEDPLTRTRTVRFIPEFDGGPASGNLAANQSVILNLPVGSTRLVVSVHKDAVINRKGKNIVFIVEDGSANIRPVSLGEAVGTRFTVNNGLKPGDIVVVRGNERLRPGQKVRF